MPNLPRRFSDAVNDLVGPEISIGRHSVPPRVEQAVNHAVAVEHGRGIVRAARVRAQEHVTAEALVSTAGLTELEGKYSQRTPDRQDRYTALVDIATAVFGNIVAEGGRE